MIRKAANNNNYRLLSNILNQDPRGINEADSSGRTAIFIAAERNHVESLHVLLEFGADSNIRTVKGILSYVFYCHIDFVL